MSRKSKYADSTRSHSKRAPTPSSWTRESSITVNMCYTVRLTHHSAKKQVTEQGGKIEHEFKLVKGFTYVFHSTTSHIWSPC